MPLIDLGRTSRKEIQELRRANDLKEKEITRQKKIQMTLVKDILTLTETAETNVGNDYQDYSTAVQAISDKYNNKSSWGCLQTGQIIDLRSAFILGEGIKVVPRTTRKDAEAELEWVEKFFGYNSLDAEMAQELVKEAEIEGKLALSLSFDKEEVAEIEGGMVTARFVPWTEKKYVITADPNDYLWYREMKWTPTDKDPVTLKEPDFVYKKFGGRIHIPNEAQPKIMKCLTLIDRLDKALKDLRTIDHLYSAPTPDFECDTAEQVEYLSEALQGTEGRQNWRFGSLIIHTGRFSIKGIDSAGVTNLIAEIELLIKMISGITGIPIHFLGLLDLLRNRATGDNTRELINASTTKEREIWKGAYQELIEKSMKKWNEATGAVNKSTALDPSKIRVEIPLVTQEHWDRIRDVLLPAASQGVISNEYVASQIPGVDAEKEAERKAVSDASELERVKSELEKARLESEAGIEGKVS
jgi:hypothetical protein